MPHDFAKQCRRSFPDINDFSLGGSAHFSKCHLNRCPTANHVDTGPVANAFYPSVCQSPCRPDDTDGFGADLGKQRRDITLAVVDGGACILTQGIHHSLGHGLGGGDLTEAPSLDARNVFLQLPMGGINASAGLLGNEIKIGAGLSDPGSDDLFNASNHLARRIKADI